MGVLSAVSCAGACQPRAANTRMALRIVLMTSPGGNFILTRRSDILLASADSGVFGANMDLWCWEGAMGEEEKAPDEKIDWSQCPLVEVNPRVQIGAPVLRGSRMPVQRDC